MLVFEKVLKLIDEDGNSSYYDGLHHGSISTTENRLDAKSFFSDEEIMQELNSCDWIEDCISEFKEIVVEVKIISVERKSYENRRNF